MSEKKITIRLESKDDYRKVENLTRESFWNVYRTGCTEHYVLHCYRKDPAFVPELDFVMELDGKQLLDYSMEKAKEMAWAHLPSPAILIFMASLVLFLQRQRECVMSMIRRQTTSRGSYLDDQERKKYD